MADDLADMLGSSFQVTNRKNNPDAPHPRFAQYKNNDKAEFNQQERIRKHLENQKQRRFDMMSHVRRLAEDKWDDVEVEEDTMETTETRPGRRYRDNLMLSEWMLEIPSDFEKEWIMVPAPTGKRCLVVAALGKTKAFLKNGRCMNVFNSKLPGGNTSTEHWKQDSCILDCIYCELSETFYILDLMSWKCHPVYDSETEFRFYWADTKVSEHEEIMFVTKLNRFKFELLPRVPCNKASMEEVLDLASQMSDKLDGLLFYHKRCHYTFGASPLVLWLKAYMLPELLGLTIPELYMQDIPSTYQSFSHHVETCDRDSYSRPRRRSHGHKNKKKSMDTEQASAEQLSWASHVDKSPASSPAQSEGQSSPAQSSGGKKKKRNKKGKNKDMDFTEEADEGAQGDQELDSSFTFRKTIPVNSCTSDSTTNGDAVTPTHSEELGEQHTEEDDEEIEVGGDFVF